jgi:hypothetical protein
MVYGDSLVILSYHAMEIDTFNNIESKTRGNYYVYGIEPVCFFDGSGPVMVQNPDSFYVRYQDQILGARSQITSLTMEFDTVNTKIDSTQNQISIGLNVMPTESLPDPTNLRLFTVIYEDSAPYISTFPPFPTKHSLFVVRKILPDTSGLNLTVNFPNSFDTTFTSTIENWDKTQIGVAAFVQNIETKKVLQAVVKRNFPEVK